MASTERVKKVILTEEFEKPSAADTLVITRENLYKFLRKDARIACTEFMNGIPNLVISGKTVKEWFRYNNTSLWWFVHPVLFPHIEDCIRFVEQLDNLLDEVRPTSVEVRGFYNKMDLINQICERRNIEVTTPFLAKSRLGAEALKKRVKMRRFNTVTRAKIEKRLSIADKLGRGKISVKEGCVILVSPNTYRKTIYDFHSRRFVRGERIVQKILEEIKRRADLLCIDVDYTFKGDPKTLEERMCEKDQLWVPSESFITDRVKAECREPIEHVRNNVSRLLHDEEFRQNLVYNGYSLWNTIDFYFEALLTDAYIPYYVMSIEAAKNLLTSFKPRSVFLIYETGPYAKAFVVPAVELGIRTVGIQHGVIHDRLSEYTIPDLAVNSSNLGNPIPTTMLVFGEFTRKFLTEEYHYPRERVVVVGHPEYDSDFQKDLSAQEKKAILDDLGLSSSNKTILIATSKRQKRHASEDYDVLMVSSIIKDLGTRNDLQIILKPHPTEDTTVYKLLVDKYKASNVRILTNPIQQLLPVCDVFVTVASTTANEALLFNKLVVITQFVKFKEFLPWAESGAALGVKVEELPNTLLRIIEDKELVERLKHKSMEFVKEHFNFPSTNINQRIADILLGN